MSNPNDTHPPVQQIQNRIKEMRQVRAGDLVPNDENWRVHSGDQVAAVSAVLREVGYVDALLAREDPVTGSLILIDGHLRAGLDPDQVVPVLILDVDEDEARKILATFDPLAAMAETDQRQLDDLLANIEFDEAELRKLASDMESGLEESGDDDGEGGGEGDGPPEMELQAHEHYDYVLVLARTAREWNRLCDLLEIEEVRLASKRLGVGRGVAASRVIAMLEKGRE